MRLSHPAARTCVLLGAALLVAVPLLLYGEMAANPPSGLGFDLHVFWQAARSVGHGASPYDPAGVAHMRELAARHPHVQPIAPWAVYPPALFVALVPLGLLPWHVAAAIGLIAVALSTGLALAVLGVRDWRCYAVAYASMPVVSSISLGTISPLLLVGFALIWRGRSTTAVAAATIVAKLFLWPVVAVVALEGRRHVLALALGTLLAGVGSWVFIGFADIARYPQMVSDLSAVEAHNSFSTTGLAYALGIDPQAGTVAGLVLGLGACVLAYRAGRRGSRDAAFTLVLVASLLASPIVWPHYLVLLFAPLAVRVPRFHAIWLAPLLLWLHPLQASSDSPFAFAVVWTSVAIVVAGALRPELLHAPRRRRSAMPRHVSLT